MAHGTRHQTVTTPLILASKQDLPQRSSARTGEPDVVHVDILHRSDAANHLSNRSTGR